MRVYAACVAVALGAAGCGAPQGPGEPAPPAATSTAATLNPARIDRVRQDLPDGYEFAPIDARVTPIALWGFEAHWLADPPECGALAAPAVDPGTARGWSGSGPGGIVYAVVARATAPADPDLADHCAEWTVTGGHSVGAVTSRPAPAIEGARTAGMATAVRTVVEGGTETRSHADTFTADLGDHYCSVTVVTDPGSAETALDARYAADLLVKSVSALRG